MSYLLFSKNLVLVKKCSRLETVTKTEFMPATGSNNLQQVSK